MTRKVFHNATIITLDERDSVVGGLCTEGEWVTAHLGSGGAGDGGGAEYIDLGGASVLPGFNDNHLHALVMGDHAAYPDLSGLDERGIVEALRARYDGAGRRETVIGFGWDYPFWPEPHRRVLDTVFPDNPVVLFQFSGHGACVNTAMLKRMRLDNYRGDPPGGRIMRDEAGAPTGVLTDGAVEPLHNRRFNELNGNPRLATERLRYAMRVFAEHGITSVQDNTWNLLSVWWLNRLYRRHEMSARFRCWPLGTRGMMQAAMRLAPYRSGWVMPGPHKYFLDGAFSTRTAWLIEPYAGEPQNYGTPVLHGGALRSVLRTTARRGRQAAFHAIGDRAVREFLDAVEEVAEEYPRISELRLRLEHAQLIDPADTPRLRRLGILIAAQPHALSSPQKDRELLGSERAARAYPYRSLLDAGVPLSFGSDAPAERSIAPLQALQYAATRPGPEQITVLEGLRCYTTGSAYAEGAEQEKGTLAPGMRADFVVLSENPLQVDPHELGAIRVLRTVVGGREVYRSAELA